VTRAVRELENARLAEALALDPAHHLFPLFVCRHAPGATSPAVVVGGRIEGALICGTDCGAPFVPDAWLVSGTSAAARLLLEAHGRRQAPPPLCFPPVFEHLVRAALPASTRLGALRHYALTRPPPPPAGLSIEELGPARLSAITIDAAMAPQVGAPARAPAAGFFGVVEGEQLIACADVLVSAGPVATIQQVFTHPDHRRRGLAAALVRHLARLLIARGQAATYLVDEDNAASVRLAESVGFQLWERIGWTLGL